MIRKILSPVNQGAIIHVQDWADEKLRHLLRAHDTGNKGGGNPAYAPVLPAGYPYTLRYHPFLPDRQRGRRNHTIEHIRQLQLQGKDSTNIFNQSDNGRKRSKE